MKKQMTLEEKIGQMIMPSFRRWNYAQKDGALLNQSAADSSLDPTSAGDYRKPLNPSDLPDLDVLPDEVAEAVSRLNLGGVVLFAQNCRSTEKTLKLVLDLQNAATGSPSGLPLLIGIDQEGGNVTRLGEGCRFCGNKALGDRDDLETTCQTAAFIGEELACLGINTDFAPVSDVNNNPANPVIGRRSFGDDPQLCARHTAAYVQGLQSTGVAATLKHFPGHGDTNVDSHIGLPCIEKSRQEVDACELVPFKAGIEAGAQLVMTAHIQYPALDNTIYHSPLLGQDMVIPATMSEKILTGLLRKELGFEGLIVSDALDMKAIANTIPPMDAARMVINAGMDIILMPVNPTDRQGLEELKDYIDGIAAMVRDGQIPMARIDESVDRIRRFKQENKILKQETLPLDVSVERAMNTVGCAAHKDYENKLLS